MSFLKNLRSTISRKNSVRSQNDNSKRIVCTNRKKDSSRESDKKCTEKSKQNPEEKLKTESVLRSDTYTIIDESGNVLIKEESISGEIRKSEKNMFSKFGTFSRKKKNKTEKKESNSIEQTTGWYRIQHETETTNISNPPSSGNEISNILYDQNIAVSPKKTTASIEYGTYRKNKLPDDINKKLEFLKSESKSTGKSHENSDKFKTVTLKSFRKSFRDRFLSQQKDVPYNPAWFIEVEQPAIIKKDEENEQEMKQRDLFVFENENYRPTSRSPVRNTDRSPSRNRTPARSPHRKHSNSNAMSESRSRSSTRSSMRRSEDSTYSNTEKSSFNSVSNKPSVTVKRNETFRIERDNLEPSIRIEIRNSISPNEPGRIVPVGVAKPIVPLGSDEDKTHHVDSSDRHMKNRNRSSRSSSINNRNCQTKIHITPSVSDPHTNNSNSSHQQQPYNNNRNNKLSAMSSRSKTANKSVPHSSSKRSKPIVDNYLPLTSYELLTKIRPRSTAVIPDKNIAVSGKYQNLRNVSSQSNKSLLDKYQPSSNLNSTARKQKTSIYIEDNSVRKDSATSNPSAYNSKKHVQIKIPWR